MKSLVALLMAGLAWAAETRPVEDLLKDLDSTEAKTQHDAMMGLIPHGAKAKAAVPRLTAILKSAPEGDVKHCLDCDAVTALGAIGPDAKAAIPEMLARLRSKKRSPDYPWSFANALVAIDGPRIEAIRVMLLQPAPRCGGKRLFGSAVVKTHPAETVKLLIALTGDTEYSVRYLAIGVLGGDDSLAGAQYMKPTELLTAAGDAAKQIPDVFEKLLTDKEPTIRLEAAKALMTAAPDRAEKGIAVVVAAIRSGEMRSKKPGVGPIAARLLMPAPEKAALALRPLLDDNDAQIRIDTVEVLSNLSVDKPMEELLKSDKSARVRTGAAKVLGKRYAQQSKPALIAALKDEDQEVRFRSALAIVNISRGEDAAAVVPVLVEALADSRAEIRLEAAEEFPRIGLAGQAAAPKLRESLKDPDLEVRLSAGLGLVAVAPKDAAVAVPALVEGLEMSKRHRRYKAYLALAEIGPDAKAALPLLWKHSADDKRISSIEAAEAIARIDSASAEKAVNLLVKRMIKGRNDPTTCVEVAESLERIGPAAKLAVPALCDLLKAPETASALFSMLAVKLDPEGAKPAREWMKAKIALGSGNDECLDIMRRIRREGARAKPFVPELLQWIKTGDEHDRADAIHILGKIGPAAKETLPVLRELEKNDASETVRDMARKIIKLIEAKE